MQPPPAYILAGGRSSRFGTDKARAAIDGVPLIVRIADVLQSACARVTVVSDVADKFADLGLPTIADRTPGLGPMGGLHAALEHLQGDWLLLTSCDLVTLERDWLDALIAQGRGNALAVAFKPPDGWQPLLALYHRGLLPEVIARIARGERPMRRLLDAVEAVTAPLPSDWPDLLQVNTPEELSRFRSRGGKPRG